MLEDQVDEVDQVMEIKQEQEYLTEEEPVSAVLGSDLEIVSSNIEYDAESSNVEHVLEYSNIEHENNGANFSIISDVSTKYYL